MSTYEMPAGIWVLRRLELEAKAQGSSLSAYDKWALKQSAKESPEAKELTKRTVSLIRSSITRSKRNPDIPLIPINEQLVIPQDWFESYKTVYTSNTTTLLGDCLQKAFKGCPEWGETEPWCSPEYIASTKENHFSFRNGNPENSVPKDSPKPNSEGQSGVGGLILGSVSILIALIGGGAVAVPFGIYAISQGRKLKNSKENEKLESRGKLSVTLGIIGIALGVLLYFVRLNQ